VKPHLFWSLVVDAKVNRELILQAINIANSVLVTAMSHTEVFNGEQADAGRQKLRNVLRDLQQADWNFRSLKL
jgi:hypothetical protein